MGRTSSASESSILERLTPPETMIEDDSRGRPHVDFRNVRNCVEMVVWMFAARNGRTGDLQYFINDCQKMITKMFRVSTSKFKHEGMMQQMVLYRLRRHLKYLLTEILSLRFDYPEVEDIGDKSLRFWGMLLDFAESVDKEDANILQGIPLTIYNPEFKVLKVEDCKWEDVTFQEDEPVFTLNKENQEEEEIIDKLKHLPIQEKEDNRDTPESQANRLEIMSRMKEINDEEFKEITSF